LRKVPETTHRGLSKASVGFSTMGRRPTPRTADVAPLRD